MHQCATEQQQQQQQRCRTGTLALSVAAKGLHGVDQHAEWLPPNFTVSYLLIFRPQSRGRVKELERQLEDQKGIFARRVRELEAKIRVGLHRATLSTPRSTAALLPPISASNFATAR